MFVNLLCFVVCWGFVHFTLSLCVYLCFHVEDFNDCVPVPSKWLTNAVFVFCFNALMYAVYLVFKILGSLSNVEFTFQCCHLATSYFIKLYTLLGKLGFSGGKVGNRWDKVGQLVLILENSPGNSSLTLNARPTLT